MSLSAREEQILGSIEDGLARSDPKLARTLAAFTRLVSGEEMPVREKVRAVGLVAGLSGRRRPRRDTARRDTARRDSARRDTARRDTARRDSASRRAHRLCQRLGVPRYGMLWLAAVAAVALVAVALVTSHGSGASGRGSCTTSWSPSSAVCAGQVPAHPPGSGAHKAASGQSSRAG